MTETEVDDPGWAAWQRQLEERRDKYRRIVAVIMIALAPLVVRGLWDFGYVGDLFQAIANKAPRTIACQAP